MKDSKENLEVARSLYAQMCHFHDETEEHKQLASKTTKKTAHLVQSIGTLLVIFVVVIGFYISELAEQFVQIVHSMEKMNSKVVVISEQMSNMKGDMVGMNSDIKHMDEVLVNMKKINHHIDGMGKEIESITGNIIHFNELGLRAMGTMESMNSKMTDINQSTGHMNYKMHEIATPAKYFPRP